MEATYIKTKRKIRQENIKNMPTEFSMTQINEGNKRLKHISECHEKIKFNKRQISELIPHTYNGVIDKVLKIELMRQRKGSNTSPPKKFANLEADKIQNYLPERNIAYNIAEN